MSFDRECLRPMSISRRCLVQCIERDTLGISVSPWDSCKDYIGLLTGLYTGIVSALKCGGGVFSFFPVNTDVRQVCVLVPFFFF